MTTALRAQERLHNAVTKLESLMQNISSDSVAHTQNSVATAVSEDMEILRRENLKLRNNQEKAKLRLDTLIGKLSEGNTHG